MNPTYAQAMALLNTIQPNLRQAITDQLNGHPRAQAYDSDKTTGGGGSDPTATAATTPDRARHDLEQHDAAVDRAYRALLCLAALSDKYLPQHEPKRRTLIAETKGCAWHEQAGVDLHQTVWRTTDAGFLKEPVPLCRPCYDFAHTHQARPTNEQIIRHSKGKGWTVRTHGKRASVFTAKQIAEEWNGAA